MVARGVVAKAIDSLNGDGVDRVDIVYICSNGDIAAQNVRKLDVDRYRCRVAQPADAARQTACAICATSPSTSSPSRRERRSSNPVVHGQVPRTRHLLYWLLREAW